MPISVTNRATFNPTTVSHGKLLTSSNTGVPSGTTLTDQATSGGTIPAGDYVNKRFPDPSPDGFYSVPNGPATFTNCEFTGGLIIDTANDGSLKFCSVQGGFSGSTSHRWLVEDCHFTDPGGDFFHLTGDTPAGSTCDDWTVRRCLFDTIIPENVIAGAHLDGIQTRGVVRLVLDKCAWRMGAQFDNNGEDTPLNASVFLENANGGSNTVTITDCYLDGGGQVLFFQLVSGTFTVTGNRFGPNATFTRIRNEVPITPSVWSGNVIDADDTPLNY